MADDNNGTADKKRKRNASAAASAHQEADEPTSNAKRIKRTAAKRRRRETQKRGSLLESNSMIPASVSRPNTTQAGEKELSPHRAIPSKSSQDQKRNKRGKSKPHNAAIESTALGVNLPPSITHRKSTSIHLADAEFPSIQNPPIATEPGLTKSQRKRRAKHTTKRAAAQCTSTQLARPPVKAWSTGPPSEAARNNTAPQLVHPWILRIDINADPPIFEMDWEAIEREGRIRAQKILGMKTGVRPDQATLETQDSWEVTPDAESTASVSASTSLSELRPASAERGSVFQPFREHRLSEVSTILPARNLAETRARFERFSKALNSKSRGDDSSGTSESASDSGSNGNAQPKQFVRGSVHESFARPVATSDSDQHITLPGSEEHRQDHNIDDDDDDGEDSDAEGPPQLFCSNDEYAKQYQAYLAARMAESEKGVSENDVQSDADDLRRSSEGPFETPVNDNGIYDEPNNQSVEGESLLDHLQQYVEAIPNADDWVDSRRSMSLANDATFETLKEDLGETSYSPTEGLQGSASTTFAQPGDEKAQVTLHSSSPQQSAGTHRLFVITSSIADVGAKVESSPILGGSLFGRGLGSPSSKLPTDLRVTDTGLSSRTPYGNPELAKNLFSDVENVTSGVFSDPKPLRHSKPLSFETPTGHYRFSKITKHGSKGTLGTQPGIQTNTDGSSFTLARAGQRHRGDLHASVSKEDANISKEDEESTDEEITDDEEYQTPKSPVSDNNKSEDVHSGLADAHKDSDIPQPPHMSVTAMSVKSGRMSKRKMTGVSSKHFSPSRRAEQKLLGGDRSPESIAHNATKHLDKQNHPDISVTQESPYESSPRKVAFVVREPASLETRSDDNQYKTYDNVPEKIAFVRLEPAPNTSVDSAQATNEASPLVSKTDEESSASAQKRASAKKRRTTRAISEHFITDRVDKYNATARSKRVPAGTSSVPVPSIKDFEFGIVQEKLWREPFWLLIAVTFLNKTTGRSAVPVFWKIKKRWATPALLADADPEHLLKMIECLGLQHQRTKRIISIAHAWVTSPPEANMLQRVLHYPLKGDGKGHKKGTVVEESGNECAGALEIGHMPGCGPYAWDSWRIFCRDIIRGVATDYNGQDADSDDFEPEWKRVVPQDKELRACLRWMWLREGFIWDPLTGKRREATEEEMVNAVKGEMEIEDEEEAKFAAQAAGVDSGSPTKALRGDLGETPEKAKCASAQAELAKMKAWQTSHAKTTVDTVLTGSQDNIETAEPDQPSSNTSRHAKRLPGGIMTTRPSIKNDDGALGIRPALVRQNSLRSSSVEVIEAQSSPKTARRIPPKPSTGDQMPEVSPQKIPSTPKRQEDTSVAELVTSSGMKFAMLDK